MMLAHVRNGQVITTYPKSEGWVILENGDRASPPVAGYENGNDKVLPVKFEEVDNAHSDEKISEVDWVVEETQVIRRTTLRDAPQQVPDFVTTAQARLALRRANLFDTIQAGLEALPEPQRTEALEAWEYSPYISRKGQLVTTLAKQFGLSDELLDLLFTQANLIKL